ncbi:MAG: lamin tail domain-containing protein [Candidatus Cloacimonetes bacterium]|nr:lamin tail domain-containing protein [Candidatus Cloacimonadota bacterium]
MKKYLMWILSFLMMSSLVYAQADDLFFSEYIEGSYYNKALEIFNGTESEIDLSDYYIKHSSHGDGWIDTAIYYFPAGSVIASNDVFVLANDDSDNIILNHADEVFSNAAYDYFMSFNGDDAIGLWKLNGRDDILLDVIGLPDEDPGTAWEVAGVSGATANHTLVRKAAIIIGNTDWALSAGTDATDSEWIVNAQDSFDYLGFHTFEGGDDTTPPSLLSATALSNITVKLNFSEAVSLESAENSSNYEIVGLPEYLIVNMLSSSSVLITTSEQTEGEIYTIVVNNVEDLNENVIEPNSSIEFTGYVSQAYTPIADIQGNPAAFEGTEVTISGVVTIGVNVVQTGNTNVYIQDDSGRGINIFDFDPIADLVRGNLVEITGTVEDYIDSYDNPTTEITSPEVTVLETDYPIPDPLKINLAQNSDLSLEGTLLQVTGIIFETYYAGGGTNLNIKDDENNTVTVRIWDSTGLDLSGWAVDDTLQAVGIGSSYSQTLQIVPGYQDQLTVGEMGGFEDENITLYPSVPEVGDPVIIEFVIPDTSDYSVKFVICWWKTDRDADLIPYEMTEVDSGSYTGYQTTIAGQPEGTTVSFYIAITDMDNQVHKFFDEGYFYKYSYAISSLNAVLNIPAKPFNPYGGEKFPISFGSRSGDKAILRIYNSEGKLVLTPQNIITTNPSGINTYEWDGKDRNHNLLSLGLYYCFLEVIDSQTGQKKTAKAPIVIGAPLK